MAITLREKHYISAGSTVLMAVEYTQALDAGELLTGTPTITEVTTTDLTITNKLVNSTTLVVNDISCIAGQAVQCLVTGAVAGTTYMIKIEVSTTSTPTQRFIHHAILIGV